MWEMFANSVTLFLRGKLFKDPQKVLRQAAFGALLCAAGMVLPVLAGSPLWVGVLLGPLVGGGLQPWLFRDLKYA